MAAPTDYHAMATTGPLTRQQLSSYAARTPPPPRPCLSHSHA